MITSMHNPHVKQAVRLRNHRQRRREQLILIDGARELARAIAAGVGLREVFVCAALCRSEEARRLLEILPGSGGERLDVTEAVFAKLAFGQRTEGIVGVAAVGRRRLEDLVLPANPLVAVLEGVEKPGNVGAVLRSADGAGVSALVVADPQTDLFNPNVIRASLGTVFSLPVAAAAPGDVLAWLQGRGLQILAARVDGSVSYTEIDYREPTVIVLGGEAEGLTLLWSGDDVRAIRLPMLGVADSLNVSAAAAVIFYEALRQRTK
ncbi:MAG: RNA methyltransferase [Thermoguttaceae bacterium]|jgi:TrmH family RNA methyltransferase